MKRSFFIIIVIALAALSARADDFRGRVLDGENREPVAGAIVKVLSATGKTVSFTSSKTDGTFNVKTDSKGVRLTVSAIGYATFETAFPPENNELFLQPRETRLKEVVVEAPDIFQRGDTLVFNVGKYATAADNAIIDVLKRLPGIKVEDDGRILYNGKPINKFYIDGNDFVGDSYGLATNNISKDDVASVEVMENHQPIKALEDIEFSEHAGINLKLKEDARSRWVGVATAGAGVSPLLYTGGLFTMRLARKMQNMFTLKADNTGWNPANEIRDTGYDPMFSGEYDDEPWTDYISADRVNAPLAENRTRDNLSWMADAITSWGTNDVSKRLKLNYTGDRLDYTTGEYTDYFSQNIPNYNQDNKLRTHGHSIAAELKTEVNRKKYFMKDNLNFDARFDDSRSAITGSMDLSQRVSRRCFNVRNDLRLIRKTDTRIFSLSSRNEFSRNTSRLGVSASGATPSQSVRTSDLRSVTEGQYGLFAGFWKIYLTADLDLDWHHLASALDDFDCDFRRAGKYDSFLASFSLTPKAVYEMRGWRVTAALPFRLTHIGLDGSHGFISLRPYLWIRRQMTAKSDLTLSASYNSSAPVPSLFVDCAFLTDYRNLYVAVPTDRNSKSTSVSATYRYRNPLSAFFGNISATYSYFRSPLMTDQLFIDDFIVTTYRNIAAGTHSCMLKGGVSKGFAHGRLVGGIDAEWSRSEASSMRDGQRLPFRQDRLSVAPYFKGSFCKWLSMNYSLDATFSSLKIDEGPLSRSTSVNQRLSFTWMPLDELNFIIGAEHYFTGFGDRAGRDANMVLLDASATWQMSSRLRLSLSARNLFDRHDYRYTTFGTLSKTDRVFSIRPRNILATLQLRF